MQRTIKKPESYRKCTKKGWTGGHSNQRVRTATAQPQGKLMETDAHPKRHKSQTSETHLGGTPCNPNVMSTEEEKRGSGWQERQEPGLPPAGQARQGWCRQVTPEDTAHASSRAAPQLGRAGFIFTSGKVHKYEGTNSTHTINETLGDCD